MCSWKPPPRPRPALLWSPGLGSASRLPVVLHPPCRHQDLASVDTVDSDGAWAEFQCTITEHRGEERRQHTTQQWSRLQKLVQSFN